MNLSWSWIYHDHEFSDDISENLGQLQWCFCWFAFFGASWCRGILPERISRKRSIATWAYQYFSLTNRRPNWMFFGCFWDPKIGCCPKTKTWSIDFLKWKKCVGELREQPLCGFWLPQTGLRFQEISQDDAQKEDKRQGHCLPDHAMPKTDILSPAKTAFRIQSMARCQSIGTFGPGFFSQSWWYF